MEQTDAEKRLLWGDAPGVCFLKLHSSLKCKSDLQQSLLFLRKWYKFTPMATRNILVHYATRDTVASSD
jgi:hypothetical protein